MGYIDTNSEGEKGAAYKKSREDYLLSRFVIEVAGQSSRGLDDEEMIEIPLGMAKVLAEKVKPLPPRAIGGGKRNNKPTFIELQAEGEWYGKK